MKNDKKEKQKKFKEEDLIETDEKEEDSDMPRVKGYTKHIRNRRVRVKSHRRRLPKSRRRLFR